MKDKPNDNSLMKLLEEHAPAIELIHRLTRSSRLTAEFLTERLGRKITKHAVALLSSKVRRGEIVITAEQLGAVAREHPIAQRFAEYNPEILDPTKAPRKPTKKVAKKVITKPAKKVAKKVIKKTAKKVSTAKKVAKKAATKRALKTTTTKVGRKSAKAKPTAKKPKKMPKSNRRDT